MNCSGASGSDTDSDNEVVVGTTGENLNENGHSCGHLHGLGGPLAAIQDENKIELLKKAKANFDRALEEARDNGKAETDGVLQSTVYTIVFWTGNVPTFDLFQVYMWSIWEALETYVMECCWSWMRGQESQASQ